MKNVVWSTTFAAVTQAKDGTYDCWKWSGKKWTRLGITACGWSSLKDAEIAAEQINAEIIEMLEGYRTPPSLP